MNYDKDLTVECIRNHAVLVSVGFASAVRLLVLIALVIAVEIGYAGYHLYSMSFAGGIPPAPPSIGRSVYLLHGGEHSIDVIKTNDNTEMPVMPAEESQEGKLLTIRELKALAKAKKIPHYGKMNKVQLVQALGGESGKM